MRASEILGNEQSTSQIHAALVEGEEVLGEEQYLYFTPYIRVILPIDGFAFWMNASLLTPEMLSAHGLQSSTPVGVQCSMHYASAAYQEADQTIVIRQIEMTSPTPVDAFGALSADVMYVGTVETPLGSFKFTFSRRNNYYRDTHKAADLYHYVGDAVYPAFDDVLIETQADFDQRQVVSNSLPIWLSMFSNPPFPSPITINVPIYPADLVLENSSPPYIAVEIEERPRLLQPIPFMSRNSSVRQMCADAVRLITYGLRNDEIMDLRDYVLWYSEVTGIIGIMDPPVIMDVRRRQVELAAIAIKKQVELSVSYNQQRARDQARQLIIKAGVQVSPNPNIIPVFPPPLP